MSEQTFHSIVLQGWLERMRGGDDSARDELLRCVGTRLETLTRRMLKGFPNVRRSDETMDVLNSAAIRLLRSLTEVDVPSTRDFMNLAALHIRRELLNLASRHTRRPRLESLAQGAEGVDFDPPEAAACADLERWERFHEAVDQLPTEQREVVGLTFYHGWTQAQVAELLKITDRTVRRHWQAACLRLNKLVGGELPPAAD